MSDNDPSSVLHRLNVAEHRLGSLYRDALGHNNIGPVEDDEPVVPLALEDTERFTELRRWIGERVNRIEPS